jgi:hypothetical protein
VATVRGDSAADFSPRSTPVPTWQQAAQVELDSAVPAVADVQVDGAACSLWKESLQVRCITNAQFLDVRRTICIHGIGTGFLRCWNVRAGDDDTFHFNNLTECDRGQEETNCRNPPAKTPGERSLYDKLLSLVLCRCNKLTD